MISTPKALEMTDFEMHKASSNSSHLNVKSENEGDFPIIRFLILNPHIFLNPFIFWQFFACIQRILGIPS